MLILEALLNIPQLEMKLFILAEFIDIPHCTNENISLQCWAIPAHIHFYFRKAFFF